jgi:hypothetical protein
MDKQAITLQEWYDLPRNIQQFINLWQEKHGQTPTATPSLSQVLQLHRAVCRSQHSEESDGRTFNYNLIGEEFAIQWDGEQIIDIAFYEVVQGIKKRLALTVPS